MDSPEMPDRRGIASDIHGLTSEQQREMEDFHADRGKARRGKYELSTTASSSWVRKASKESASVRKRNRNVDCSRRYLLREHFKHVFVLLVDELGIVRLGASIEKNKKQLINYHASLHGQPRHIQSMSLLHAILLLVV